MAARDLSLEELETNEAREENTRREGQEVGREKKREERKRMEGWTHTLESLLGISGAPCISAKTPVWLGLPF